MNVYLCGLLGFLVVLGQTNSQQCPGTCNRACGSFDVILGLDLSGSIWRPRCHVCKEYLKAVFQHLYAVENDVQSAYLNWRKKVLVQWTFADNTANNILDDATRNATIDALKRSRGDTHTNLALIRIREMVVNEARPDACKVVVLITDGGADTKELTRIEADNLRAVQPPVKICLIALEELNSNQVGEIDYILNGDGSVPHPGEFMQVHNRSDLLNYVDETVNCICTCGGVPTTTTVPPPPTTTKIAFDTTPPTTPAPPTTPKPASPTTLEPSPPTTPEPAPPTTPEPAPPTTPEPAPPTTPESAPPTTPEPAPSTSTEPQPPLPTAQETPPPPPPPRSTPPPPKPCSCELLDDPIADTCDGTIVLLNSSNIDQGSQSGDIELFANKDLDLTIVVHLGFSGGMLLPQYIRIIVGDLEWQVLDDGSVQPNVNIPGLASPVDTTYAEGDFTGAFIKFTSNLEILFGKSQDVFIKLLIKIPGELQMSDGLCTTNMVTEYVEDVPFMQ